MDRRCFFRHGLALSAAAACARESFGLFQAPPAAGAKATLLFVDVGAHDFPVAAYPAVREWLRRFINE